MANYNPNANEINEDLQEKCQRLEALVAELTAENLKLTEQLHKIEVDHLFQNRQVEDLQEENNLMQEELDVCYGINQASEPCPSTYFDCKVIFTATSEMLEKLKGI
ncbi:MAG: hypothetical protein WA064_00780 [Candidatus Moraniibacteriota bacterium]